MVACGKRMIWSDSCGVRESRRHDVLDSRFLSCRHVQSAEVGHDASIPLAGLSLRSTRALHTRIVILRVRGGAGERV